MFTFKQFLLQEQSFEKLTTEQFIQLLRSDEYSDSYKCLKNADYLLRGMSTSYGPFAAIDRTNSERTPLPGGEIYTKLLQSNPKNANWPRRTKSTICTPDWTTAEGWAESRKSGDVYCILPKNGVKLGVIPTNDIWGLRVKINPSAIDRRLDDDTIFESITVKNLGSKISALIYYLQKIQVSFSEKDIDPTNLISKLKGLLDSVKGDERATEEISIFIEMFADDNGLMEALKYENTFSNRAGGKSRLIDVSEIGTLNGIEEVWFEGQFLCMRKKNLEYILSTM